MSLLSTIKKENLPDSWNLNNIGAILNNSQYGTNKASADDGNMEIVGMKNIQDGNIFTDNLTKANLTDADREKFALNKGDILINRTNSYDLVGKVGLYNSDKVVGFASYLVRLSVDRKKADSVYINLWLNSYLAQGVIKRIATRAVSQANINPTEFKKFCPVPLPPLPEQKTIADLLSTWDKAIEKTERLIQTKKKRFKRFLHDLIYKPSIHEKWKEVRTKCLFKERRETRRENLLLLSITNGEGVIPRGDTNRKDTSNNDKSKYLRICPEDIGYNTMRMWQGVSALSTLEGIVSPAYTICIPGERLFPQFVAYLFKMPFMIHRFYRYSQGLTSDTWNLKYPHFCEVKMPLPPLEEQKQIAETLSTIQQEIDLLKQLSEKYKTQKRGLMQKLLTGKWRVKPEILKTYEEA